MRKDLLAARHLMKAEQMKSEMHKYSSIAEWAKDIGKSKQCIAQRLETYGLSDYWKKNFAKTYRGIHDHLCTYGGRSILKMYFGNNTNKAFYLLHNIEKNWVPNIISSLKNNTLSNKGFQEDFNKYGYEALRCEIVVRGKGATKENLIKYIQSGNCYNIRNRLSGAEKREKAKNKSMHDNNKRWEKTVLLPRPTITTVGVTWNFRAQKYVAQPRVNGKQTYLGYFKTEKEAGDAIKKAVNNG